ncbi:MAG: hypothetical protein GKR86_13540, partial [Ilumatobacter sp.]|nr:hypothetical protein [Ilumatobacter sp.]
MTSHIVVQLSEDPSDSSVPSASFTNELITALVAREDVAVTILGDSRTIASRADGAEAEVVDLATANLPAITASADAVVQSHPFQPRPLHLPTVTVVHDMSAYTTPWAWGTDRAASVRSLHKNLIRADAVVTPYPALVDQL